MNKEGLYHRARTKSRNRTDTDANGKMIAIQAQIPKVSSRDCALGAQ
jgi:hypothetical protein